MVCTAAHKDIMICALDLCVFFVGVVFISFPFFSLFLFTILKNVAFIYCNGRVVWSNCRCGFKLLGIRWNTKFCWRFKNTRSFCLEREFYCWFCFVSCFFLVGCVWVSIYFVFTLTASVQSSLNFDLPLVFGNIRHICTTTTATTINHHQAPLQPNKNVDQADDWRFSVFEVIFCCCSSLYNR